MWVLLNSKPHPDLVGFAPRRSLDTFVMSFFFYDVSSIIGWFLPVSPLQGRRLVGGSLHQHRPERLHPQQLRGSSWFHPGRRVRTCQLFLSLSPWTSAFLSFSFSFPPPPPPCSFCESRPAHFAPLWLGGRDAAGPSHTVTNPACIRRGSI